MTSEFCSFGLRRIVAISMTAFVALWSARATGQVFTPPDQDIWTTSVYSYKTGSAGPGGGAADEYLRVGGWGDLYYSLIQFDLTGLPKTATSVKLRLYNLTANGGTPTPLKLYQITQYWNWQTQGTGSDRLRLWWADQPNATLVSPTPLPAPAVGDYYYIDITDLYKGWQSGTIPNYGVELRPVNNNNNFDFFASSRHPQADWQPALVIESILSLSNFPLAQYTPYNVPIVTVFDHSMQTAENSGVLGLYKCDGEVMAFTGDSAVQAQINNRYNSFGSYPGDTNCRDGLGYTSSTTNRVSSPFVLSGVNYTGIHRTGPSYLFYDGHPGYDYRASIGTAVYSVTSGTIFYPRSAVGMVGQTSSTNRYAQYDAYCKWHVLGLLPDAGQEEFRIYYLHLETHENDFISTLCPTGPYSQLAPVMVFTATRPDCYRMPDGNLFTPTTLPLPSGTHVEAGCQIAFSGQAGVVGSPHLHFEIQKIVPKDAVNTAAQSFPLTCFVDGQPPYTEATFDRDDSRVCLPQDPYGWACPPDTCPDGDPYQLLTGLQSRKYWAE